MHNQVHGVLRIARHYQWFINPEGTRHIVDTIAIRTSFRLRRIKDEIGLRENRKWR